MDFAHCERLGQDAGEAEKESELIAALRRMDVVTTDTCINYQTVYQPHLGEHVAWGDTGTVIYANSVFGARSNFEAGPAALAAALTGRTPEYGFHLDAAPQGHVRGRAARRSWTTSPTGARSASWSANRTRTTTRCRCSTATTARPRADELKHLGAALASYGSMGMFHFVGVTPGSAVARGGARRQRTDGEIVITDADLEARLRGLQPGRWRRAGWSCSPARSSRCSR